MKTTTKIMFCMVLFNASTQVRSNTVHEIPMPIIQSIEEVVALFPKTVLEIKQLTETTITRAEQQIITLLQMPLDQLTFDNTVRFFDRAVDTFSRTIGILEIILMLYPQAYLREAAQKELVKLRQLFVDLFSQNKDLYLVLARHEQMRAPLEDLTEQERYFMQETLEDYRRHGLDLADDKQQIIKALQKELADLTTLFEKNINDDTSTIQVNKEELKGIDEDFINALIKTADGLYILGVDYPTYYKIMEQCEHAPTRKKLYEAFTNRAYPANIDVLEKIIAKRDELAKLLNFESFAHLNIAGEMAKSPEIVEEFLNTVLEKAQAKEASEFERLTTELPPSVTLSSSGKIQPWDKLFANETYKKQYYNIDEYKLAEYFPLEETLEGLFSIYQQFFSLKFEKVPVAGLWHREVTTLKVYRNTVLLGFLLLDLHPRDYKYKHACQATIIPALKTKEGIIKPAVAVVVANFPKSTGTKPALLLRSDVNTFFHEFGHALHALLGATELATQSGTSVKHDFVEMPSQMLEEWLLDHDILHNLSHHYQTGEKLSPEIIKTLIEVKNLNIGGWLTRQLFFSFQSLEYFKEGAQKDTQTIAKTLHEKIRMHDQYDTHNHFQASFGHLTNYGARYYGYLWSKVFALDLFKQIKKHGLLNPTIGDKYIATILSQGGSKDPNELLFDFLGRNPNTDAFFHDLGL